MKELIKLETVLDSLSIGIMVCDKNHNLVMANKYALRFLPINSVEQIHEPLWNLVNDDKVASFLESTLKSGDKIEEIEFSIEITGHTRYYNLSVMPMVQKLPDKSIEVSGSLIHVVDITEKKTRDARMRRIESLASLTTLAAGVAHEIKNPLASLSIHVQLIYKALSECRALCGSDENKIKQPKQNLQSIDRYISVVNEEIERLNQIVVDFLFAVRPMDLDLQYRNINNVLKEIIEFVSFELKDANIECIEEYEENIPLVKIDERIIKPAFLNIIKNAIAAMPDGGKLIIKTQGFDTYINIFITDTGIGIPEQNLTKIFEPYFTTKETGTGLGLTMVFKIIREHHGEINAASTQGEGSVFTITLPFPQKETRLIKAPGE